MKQTHYTSGFRGSIQAEYTNREKHTHRMNLQMNKKVYLSPFLVEILHSVKSQPHLEHWCHEKPLPDFFKKKDLRSK